MRKIVAGVVAGIVVFCWGAVSHMLLPLGHMGFREPMNEDAVLSAVRGSFDEAGIYYLPYVSPEQMGDEAAVEAWARKASNSPYVFAVYQPSIQGDPRAMGRQLGTQFVIDVLGGVITAFFVVAVASGFGARVLWGGVLGAFSWLTLSASYWNWYRFPWDFTFASLIIQVVAWALAGLVVAAIMRNRA